VEAQLTKAEVEAPYLRARLHVRAALLAGTPTNRTPSQLSVAISMALLAAVDHDTAARSK
jgi:hypothetical protein